jgi:hypothetical protein
MADLNHYFHSYGFNMHCCIEEVTGHSASDSNCLINTQWSFKCKNIFKYFLINLETGTTLKSEGLSGSKKLTLTALMSGGKGDVAWQHTQLFRC